MSEWKPGDVGSIDSRARFDDSRVMFTGYNWVSASGELLNRFLVPRPLVVIDPDSAEDCERLAKAWSGLRYAELGDKPMRLNAYRAQAALREFATPTPPKPDEPQNRYAVVLDADDVEWVRSRDGFWAHVRQEAHGMTRWSTRSWDDITVTRVLSEGVTS